MLNLEVAFKTLTQFDYAFEIANFLEEQQVKAITADSSQCAITQWMNKATGLDSISTTQQFIFQAVPGVEYELVGENTPAMQEFVRNFDRGIYPSLISIEDAYHHGI